MSNILSKEARNIRRKFLRMSYDLWELGPKGAHEEYPLVSVTQFEIANKYFNSLRCEGCACGSCVNLPNIADQIPNVPKELIPLAEAATKLVKEET